MIVVIVIPFMNWEFQSQLETVYRRKIWIYPVLLCAMRFINDVRYTPDEPDRPNDVDARERPQLYRQNNVEFVNDSTVKTAIDDY